MLKNLLFLVLITSSICFANNDRCEVNKDKLDFKTIDKTKYSFDSLSFFYKFLNSGHDNDILISGKVYNPEYFCSIVIQNFSLTQNAYSKFEEWFCKYFSEVRILDPLEESSNNDKKFCGENGLFELAKQEDYYNKNLEVVHKWHINNEHQLEF